MVNKKKQLAAFPWIELIPFGLYAIVALYLTTPTNVFYQKGLQVIHPYFWAVICHFSTIDALLRK